MNNFLGENDLDRLLNFFTVVLKFAIEQKSFLCRHNSKRRYGDNIEKDEIKMRKISGLKNRSDGLTKQLSKFSHRTFANANGVMSRENANVCFEKGKAEWFSIIKGDWLEGECEAECTAHLANTITS